MKQHKISLGIALGIAAPALAQQAVQWRVEDGGNGHWYSLRVTSDAVSWYEAASEAAERGGYLATLTSNSENNWVFWSVTPGPAGWVCGGDCYGPWLGGYQDRNCPDFFEPGGGWRWVTGETWEFSAWSCDLPNEADDFQDYLHFYAYGGCSQSPGPRWDDLQAPGIGGTPTSFVIEWSADCDANGVVDYGQILRGEVADVNGNGIPDTCDCPADINQSGTIDAEDLAYVLFAWGMTGGKAGDADINGDATVDANDLSLVLGSWGPCPG